MRALSFRNPHEALPLLLDLLFKTGVQRDTRNGKVLQLPGPTLIQYTYPWERVIFWPERDANPFFHAYEMLWMLAGRNDVAPLVNYAKRMASFSDDGKELNAAYGFRWREHFGYDQLSDVIANLQANPNDRRQVISMWDATCELNRPSDLQNVKSKDLPCNTHIYVAINPQGLLDITVCNRSNDLVWGLLGANCVHMSFLQEYIAAKIGVPMGSLYTLANNLHGYLETIEPLRDLTLSQGLASPYELGRVSHLPLEQSSMIEFERDLIQLDSCEYHSHFMREVFSPMKIAHDLHKKGQTEYAIECCESYIKASDWRKACTEWLRRRLIKKQRAVDDGVSYEAK